MVVSIHLRHADDLMPYNVGISDDNCMVHLMYLKADECRSLFLTCLMVCKCLNYNDLRSSFVVVSLNAKDSYSIHVQYVSGWIMHIQNHWQENDLFCLKYVLHLSLIEAIVKVLVHYRRKCLVIQSHMQCMYGIEKSIYFRHTICHFFINPPRVDYSTLGWSLFEYLFKYTSTVNFKIYIFLK